MEYGLTPSSLHKRRRDITARGTSASAASARRMQPKCVIVMVGLPARGKSYIVRMIRRYMNWLDFPTRVFNAGDYRRADGNAGASSDYFSSSPSKVSGREKYAKLALDDLLRWLTDDNGHIGILDATNTTRARRAWVVEAVHDFNPDIHVLFIESVCDDKEILDANYKMKLSNADYVGWDSAEALADFRRRVALYEKVYEPIVDEYEGALSYIKLVNVGRRVTGNMCHGLLKSELLFYLANIHVKSRRIWLVRSGETLNDTGDLRGLHHDSPLTPKGTIHAARIHEFVARKTRGALPGEATAAAAAAAAAAAGGGGGAARVATDSGSVAGAGVGSAAKASVVEAAAPAASSSRGSGRFSSLGSANPNLGVSYEVWGSTASSVRDSLDFCQAKAELIIHTSILNELGGGDFKGLGRTFRSCF
tara:strand:- start:1561 stop:2823 length:1263 start_codon:yes stop_codon:yes gene_type:complete